MKIIFFIKRKILDFNFSILKKKKFRYVINKNLFFEFYEVRKIKMKLKRNMFLQNIKKDREFEI